eukprot:357433-Chlamydomonas_euryale.AAC.6
MCVKGAGSRQTGGRCMVGVERCMVSNVGVERCMVWSVGVERRMVWNVALCGTVEWSVAWCGTVEWSVAWCALRKAKLSVAAQRVDANAVWHACVACESGRVCLHVCVRTCMHACMHDPSLPPVCPGGPGPMLPHHAISPLPSVANYLQLPRTCW